MTATPRPWKVAPREYAIDVRDKHDNLVCHISKDFDRANADAALIVHAVNTHERAKAVLSRARAALYNVPEVGTEYDQQHSDTHMRAALEIEALLTDMEG